MALWCHHRMVTLADARPIVGASHGRRAVLRRPRSVAFASLARSPAGLDYAAKHSDLILITSPTGADPVRVRELLPAHIAKIKALARGYGCKVKTIINPHVICRSTEREARAAYDGVLENQDPMAADYFVRTFQSGDTASWRGHTGAQWVIGGNVHLIGSPAQIVDWFVQLHAGGRDGVQVNLFDCPPDLAFFEQQVLPLMRPAGLRAA